MEREVKANVGNMEVLQTAKEMGFSDHYIAAAWNKTGAKFTICVKKII